MPRRFRSFPSNEMRHDHRQHSILVELAKLVAAKVPQLFLVDHLEAAIDERLFRTLRLNGHFAIHQQAGFLDLVHEGRSALAGLFELFAEIQDRFGGIRRLVAVEQWLALVEIAHPAGSRVEAERQFVAVFAQPGQQERVTADVGRNVDVAVEQLSILVEEGVGAVVKPHQGQRHRNVAGREDDREMALRQGEFVDRDRNGVGRREARHRFDRTHLEIAVNIAVQGLEAIVQKGQHVRRLARHEDDLRKRGERVRDRSPAGLACRLRARL